jgi:hypothetical protein
MIHFDSSNMQQAGSGGLLHILLPTAAGREIKRDKKRIR